MGGHKKKKQARRLCLKKALSKAFEDDCKARIKSPQAEDNELIALEFGEVGLLGVDCRFAFLCFFWQKNGADYEDEEALTRFLDTADVEEISDTDGAVASVMFVCLCQCRCLVN